MPSEEEAVRCASEHWNQGFNCAESVLRGVCHGLGVDLPEAALRMATPFGGGVGRCEDMCGALSGGVMCIGVLKGRCDPKEDRFVSYNDAKVLHDTFEGLFGSSLCKVLNDGDFISDGHRSRCMKYVLETVRITYRLLSRV